MGKASKGPPASHLSYPRLTLDDRRGIERGLDKRESLAEIARRLGRATSTVSRKVARNTVFSRPRASSGEHWSAEPPEGGCDWLARAPGVCNGCRLMPLRLPREGEGRVPRRARPGPDRRGAQRGIDETEQNAAHKIKIGRSDLVRGLSPAQIAAMRPSLSMICRCCDEATAGVEPRDHPGEPAWSATSRT